MRAYAAKKELKPMFAFHEHAENEKEKLARWKVDDPIQLQDSYNTSEAFLAACKAGIINGEGGVREILEHGEPDDFLQYHVIQGFFSALQTMNLDLYNIFSKEQNFPVSMFTEAPHLVAELCGKDNFAPCKSMLFDMYRVHGLAVDTPRKGDGFTTLCELTTIVDLNR